jgi:hypothetical protein
VFYNNSDFDNHDPAVTSADGGAVAPDKTALLPGRAATFANVTSYSRGINGVVIAFNDHLLGATQADFSFKVGNTADPSGWAEAPAPSAMVLEQFVTHRGSSVTFTWPDGAIRNTWLQVVVKPTDNTGLETADVFYWGNLVGEIGNGVSGAMVNVVDQARVRAAVSRRNVTMGSPFDFDRSGKVDAADVLLCRANVGRSLAHLTPAGAPAAASASGVFHDGGPISRTLAPRRRQPLLEL